MDPTTVMAGIQTDHNPGIKMCSNVLIRFALDAMGIPANYYNLAMLTNASAIKQVTTGATHPFVVGKLLAQNVFVTDTFKNWVQDVFGHCVFEVLVYRL